MRLEPKQSGRVGKHGPWIRPGESFSFQKLEKDLGVTPTHFRVGSAFRRRVAEVTPPFDDLLRGAAADPELQPAVADQVGRARVFDHVERILVPHVDDGRSDLDPPGSGADRREKREGRRELLGKVMNAKVCAVRTKFLRRHSQLNRLLQNITRGSRCRLARRVPMSKGQEADLLHTKPYCLVCCFMTTVLAVRCRRRDQAVSNTMSCAP